MIVPESDMTIENTFGPLFFDFLWNGLFMRGCNFNIIMYFSLFVVTKEVMSKSFLQKYITEDVTQTVGDYILSAELIGYVSLDV